MTNLNNKVMLIGNLGKDPEIKELEKGRRLAKFSLATTESYKNDAGERISETSWHNLVAWNGLATIAEKYLTKGKEVAVEGRLVYRNYEDKDGTKKYITEIILSQIQLLRGQKESVLGSAE
ncbi:MAG: single-stranded DNA-binding protein [Marinilabiliaceae bacterium]|jgi:single-strand DNA-binding protein|nr:single-stranded DNA-binding protein [Marinilabiliaceae bacterium]